MRIQCSYLTRQSKSEWLLLIRSSGKVIQGTPCFTPKHTFYVPSESWSPPLSQIKSVVYFWQPHVGKVWKQLCVLSYNPTPYQSRSEPGIRPLTFRRRSWKPVRKRRKENTRQSVVKVDISLSATESETKEMFWVYGLRISIFITNF